MLNVVDQCQADDPGDQLLRLFNEQMTSDSVVQYLRLLTSAHLQNHADFFCNFVEAPGLHVYCEQVSDSALLHSSENIVLYIHTQTSSNVLFLDSGSGDHGDGVRPRGHFSSDEGFGYFHPHCVDGGRRGGAGSPCRS